MDRRNFLKAAALTGAAFTLKVNGDMDILAQTVKSAETGKPVDLVAIMGGEPDEMFKRAIAEMGGISKFVKTGQKVVVKPNIGWDKTPELAADTNPKLVGEIVRQCVAAGAKEVLVFDHTCDDWQKCYKNSGIEDAAKRAGAKIAPGNPHDETLFTPIKLPKGTALKEVSIHKAMLECDAWFNVPVLKHHRGSNMTIAMKNCMGLVSKKSQSSFHSIGLQQCIADMCTWEKRPVLNIIDAYRIMKTNGPKGRSEADAVLVKALIAAPDIIAADTAATRFAEQFTEKSVEAVTHIGFGEAHGLGTTKLDTLKVKKIEV